MSEAAIDVMIDSKRMVRESAIALVAVSSGLVGPLHAQSAIFVEQLGLLDESAIGRPPFSSGLGLGVVDVDGNRRDDIIRLHDTRLLSIERQRPEGGRFLHDPVGTITTGTGWSVSVADVDGSGVNDILVAGNSRVGGPAGYELFLAGDTGTPFSRTMVKEGEVVVQGTIFTDLDNDGDVDIFACDDLADLEKFSNDGLGRFTAADALIPTALSTAVDDEGNYALVATDYDNDGDVDYYLSKCRQADGDPESLRRRNRLFRNDGEGSWPEPANAGGLHDANQSWAADFGDVDNDGDLDCFVLNHPFDAIHPSGPSGPSLFYANNGDGTFSDHTSASGLAGEVDFPGSQCLFRDFDNDGWLDLLVSSMASGYAYFENDRDGSFTRRSAAFKHAGGGNVAHIYSFAVGDLNHDGFLDVYASRGSGINNATDLGDLLFFNEGNSNHYLGVRLEGNASNRNGIGARIEVHGPFGREGSPGMQIREVRGGESYGIMNSLTTHFGLGTATTVDRVVVRWPSGTVDEIRDQPADQFVTLHEGTSTAALEYPDWIAMFFPNGGAAIEGDGDPDGDEVPNLIEQVLGTRPDHPSHGPAFGLEVGAASIQITLERVPTVGVRVRFETSTDGSAWSSAIDATVVESTPQHLVVSIPTAAERPPTLLLRMVASYE